MFRSVNTCMVPREKGRVESRFFFMFTLENDKAKELKGRNGMLHEQSGLFELEITMRLHS